MGTTGWRKPNPGYKPAPHEERVVRDAYDRVIRHNDRSATKKAAAKLGVPKWRINRWARELGLSRIKEPRWTAEEESLLQQFGHFTDATIKRKLRSRGFERSEAAVHLKMKRLRIKANLDGYSACSLASAFGVDVKWVTRHLNLGSLAGERRGTDRTAAQGGDMWWITRQAVKDFVLTYPDEVDLRKVEKFWFLDLLTDGRICR